MPFSQAWSGAMRSTSDHHGTQHAAEHSNGGSHPAAAADPKLDAALNQRRDVQAEVNRIQAQMARSQEIIASGGHARAENIVGRIDPERRVSDEKARVTYNKRRLNEAQSRLNNLDRAINAHRSKGNTISSSPAPQR